MSCICLNKLLALLEGLLPVASLRIDVPPVMARLSASIGNLPPASGALNLQAALRLGLPPLPLSLNMVEQISAAATASSQLATLLGIDLCAPGGPTQLGITISSLHINLPKLLPLPLPFTTNLPGALRLSLALSTIASVRARLGVDLLAPGALAQLKLALSAALGAPISPISLRLMARISAYAKLVAAAQLFGGAHRLLPALNLLAQLRLPTLNLGLGPLASLAAFGGLGMNIRAVLGLNPAAVGFDAQLRLALQPLWALSSLSLSASFGAPTAWPALSANFAADVHALLGLNLGALGGLRLPNLPPLSLVAGLAGIGGLASTSSCSATCPVGHRL